MNNKKEFGGYIEIESFSGKEYYSDLYKLNLARTSLVWLLGHIEHRRVFLPEFLCATVKESAEKAGFVTLTYKLNDNLSPVWGAEGAPGDDDVLYIVNYYGQLRTEDIEKYKDAYKNVVVDNAQAFYDKPVDGVHTIYSLRKFFGVADGAYLASDIDASMSELLTDCTGDRARYLIGRLEKGANEFYGESKAAEDGFSDEVPKQMSKFTQNMVRGIDYEAVKVKRCANYELLHSILKSENPFTTRMPSCPYAYPYYHEDGINLRRYLVERSIYIPTLWTELISEDNKGSLEYDWSSNIICLPVDQRYDSVDMRTIADAVLAYK